MQTMIRVEELKNDSMNGASFVEFIVVVPIFIILVFACIDFARYTAAKSILTTGAHRAVSLATVIPNLDLAPEERPINPELIDLARTDVITLAQNVPINSSLFTNGSNTSRITLDATPELILPTRENGQTMLQAMQDEPIEVRLIGTYDPFLPLLSNLPIRSSATGFREPRNVMTMPAPTDCFGNRLGTVAYVTECPCNMQFFGLDDDGRCTCLATDETCPGEQIANDHGCGCHCPGNQTYDEATGACECLAANNMQDTPDDADFCSCVSGDSSCGPGQAFDSFSCRCQCSGALANDCRTSGGTWNLGSCQCSCTGVNQQLVDSRCVCATPPTCQPDEVESNCVCVPNAE